MDTFFYKLINRIKYICQKIVLGMISFLPDRQYLPLWYYIRTGKSLNVDNPQTFNEKLQWLKLYNRKKIFTTMVDKYAVKQYVSSKIGDKYIIPTIRVWEKFEEIDFSNLPKKFVLKCTHDSGGLVICPDKDYLDINNAQKKIESSLRRSFYKIGREWPYKNVPKRIIAEEYLEDNSQGGLKDYKFFCFNGKALYFKIDYDRQTNHRANYYSIEGELQPFGEEVCPPDFNQKLEMPKHLDLMVSLAEKLAIDIPFVRVDFYENNDCVYFGEITFFPASGQGKFVPADWDRRLGDLIKLPIE